MLPAVLYFNYNKNCTFSFSSTVHYIIMFYNYSVLICMGVVLMYVEVHVSLALIQTSWSNQLLNSVRLLCYWCLAVKLLKNKDCVLRRQRCFCWVHPLFSAYQTRYSCSPPACCYFWMPGTTLCRDEVKLHSLAAKQCQATHLLPQNCITLRDISLSREFSLPPLLFLTSRRDDMTAITPYWSIYPNYK